MKMIKKTLSLCICLIMAFTCLSVYAEETQLPVVSDESPTITLVTTTTAEDGTTTDSLNPGVSGGYTNRPANRNGYLYASNGTGLKPITITFNCETAGFYKLKVMGYALKDDRDLGTNSISVNDNNSGTFVFDNATKGVQERYLTSSETPDVPNVVYLNEGTNTVKLDFTSTNTLYLGIKSITFEKEIQLPVVSEESPTITLVTTTTAEDGTTTDSLNPGVSGGYTRRPANRYGYLYASNGTGLNPITITFNCETAGFYKLKVMGYALKDDRDLGTNSISVNDNNSGTFVFDSATKGEQERYLTSSETPDVPNVVYLNEGTNTVKLDFTSTNTLYLGIRSITFEKFDGIHFGDITQSEGKYIRKVTNCSGEDTNVIFISVSHSSDGIAYSISESYPIPATGTPTTCEIADIDYDATEVDVYSWRGLTTLEPLTSVSTVVPVQE